MATTQNTYTGDNLTVSYSFTFPYLEETDIKVSLDGVVTTAYSLSNATTITFDTAPGTGVAIRIYRDTNNDELAATFFAGSAIRAQDLNEDFLQSNYSVQEIKTRYLDAQAPVIQGNIDMNGYRITDMGDPTSDQDATTKFYIDTRLGNISIPGHTRWRKTATASQTTFSGTGDYGGTLAYTATREQVYLNGALQQRGVDYTADNGTSIVFSVALTAGDIVDIVCVNNLTNSDLVLISDANVDDNAGIVATKLSFTQSGTGAVARTVDSKLKDVVSVKDFGAVGDGTTDDTAAIQAAIDAANTVHFPQGSYRIVVSNTTVEADPQDPENHRNLYLGLQINSSNKHLIGDNATLVVEAPESETDHVAFVLGVESGDAISNITIKGLTLDLNQTTNGSRVAQIRGMMFSNSTGIIIKDCKFYNDGDHNAANSGGYGISLIGSEEVSVDSCKFENISGGIFGAYTKDLQIVDCRFEFFNEAIDLDKVCIGTVISGCYFDGEGSTPGSTGEGIDANGVVGLSVVGNTFRDLDGTSIVVNGKYHATNYTNYSSSKLITNIENDGSDALVTSAGHGFSNSDVVYVTGIEGYPSATDTVNNRTFTVSSVTTDTFKLTGLNQTGTYTRGGAVWNTTGTTWNQAKNVTISGNVFRDTGHCLDVGNNWSGTADGGTANLHDNGDAPTQIIFNDNTIADGAGWLRVRESDGLLISNNYWRNITTTGSGSYPACIQCESEVDTTTYAQALSKSNCKVRIIGNTIDNCNTGAISIDNPGNFDICDNYITQTNTDAGSISAIYIRSLEERNPIGSLNNNTVIGVSGNDHRALEMNAGAASTAKIKVKGNSFKGTFADSKIIEVGDADIISIFESESMKIHTESSVPTNNQIYQFGPRDINYMVVRAWVAVHPPTTVSTGYANSDTNYYNIKLRKRVISSGSTSNIGTGDDTRTTATNPDALVFDSGTPIGVKELLKKNSYDFLSDNDKFITTSDQLEIELSDVGSPVDFPRSTWVVQYIEY